MLSTSGSIRLKWYGDGNTENEAAFPVTVSNPKLTSIGTTTYTYRDKRRYSLKMANRSLNLEEVALIKALLNRGLRNNEVQFYFNRPDRPVNSGRITEIKKGYRWIDVEPATDEELDAFLADLEGDVNGQADDEPEVPDQLPAASEFSLNDKGRIAVDPDPPGQAAGADPELEAMYSEMRQKTQSILGAGHNLLGAMLRPLQQFRDALPEDMPTASMTILWFRGNALRSILRAHDEVKDLPDMHPEKQDTAYAERLRDIVEGFNIFVLGDPKGRDLDNRRLGPLGREEADEAIGLAKPIADRSHEVATDAVSSLLQEQVDGAINAPNTIHGDQAVTLAQQTSSNFVIAIAKAGLTCAKSVLGGEFRDAWQKIRHGAYGAVGGAAVGVVGPLYTTTIEFVVRHIDSLSTYAGSVIGNPTVSQIFEFLAKLFS